MQILIVEDDRPAATFFSQVAKSQGMEDVDCAYSAEEALEMAVAKQYDLVTLDIQLPRASGLEVLSMLRNMCPHAVIAVISGHFPGSIDPEIAECADAMISKPISVDTYITLIQNALQIHNSMKNIRSLKNVTPQDA